MSSVPTNKALRVLLADDHPIVMAGFAMSLANNGISVVGQAKNVAEVMSSYALSHPDVVILDMRFGDKTTGIDTAKQLLQKYPNAKIIFLSQFDQDFLIKQTYQIGALAYLTKDCLPDELIAAVQKAAKGEKYFLPHISDRLANIAIGSTPSPNEILNEREMNIFGMMARGMTNAEMSEKLNLSLRTISMESNTIKHKLNATRPADIFRIAYKYGILEA